MTVKGTPKRDSRKASRHIQQVHTNKCLSAHKHATRGLLSARESLFLEPGTHVCRSPGFICAIHETRKSSFVLKISVTGNDRSLTLTKGMFLTYVISKSEVLGMEKDAT